MYPSISRKEISLKNFRILNKNFNNSNKKKKSELIVSMK